ncbi:MAG: glutathione S-transferase family protein [Proteobacteria bacterium]|nr:glutathione S-transferase family protein [Pseudomonadota bacterium]MCZ6894116.1 glutathione S-transferase family protein [Gammaproteobacteria bacterium]
MKLFIGNKNYSSWSLRPWLLLAANNISFDEVRIPLYTEGTRSELEKYAPAGKVPVLQDEDIVVWDSLAICEYVSERYLGGKGWPADPASRAEARSCCAEMHSGFFAIRENMPMNCRARSRKVTISTESEMEISRIDDLWSGCRKKYSNYGPWLFGEFSIADCMFAPVVFRFNTYDVSVSGLSKDYMNRVFEHPQAQLWLAQSKDEIETIDIAEVGI